MQYNSYFVETTSGGIPLVSVLKSWEACYKAYEFVLDWDGRVIEHIIIAILGGDILFTRKFSGMSAKLNG